jgi:hypothetical protein
VIMTGMGDSGAEGMLEMREQGAYTIALLKGGFESAVFPGSESAPFEFCREILKETV